MGPVTMYHSNCPEVVAHVDFPFLHSGRPHTPKTSMVAVYRRGCAPVKVAELLVPASMCQVPQVAGGPPTECQAVNVGGDPVPM